MSGAPQAGFLPIAAMMFLAGIGIPVFAAFNTALGKQLGGPIAATAVTFAVGLVIALVMVAVTGFPQRATFTFETPHIWFGAIFMLFYATSVAFAAPRIGLGNAIFFVLLGQIVAAAAMAAGMLLYEWSGRIRSPSRPSRHGCRASRPRSGPRR